MSGFLSVVKRLPLITFLVLTNALTLADVPFRASLTFAPLVACGAASIGWNGGRE
jgi:hypothetical protein